MLEHGQFPGDQRGNRRDHGRHEIAPRPRAVRDAHALVLQRVAREQKFGVGRERQGARIVVDGADVARAADDDPAEELGARAVGGRPVVAVLRERRRGTNDAEDGGGGGGPVAQTHGHLL